MRANAYTLGMFKPTVVSVLLCVVATLAQAQTAPDALLEGCNALLDPAGFVVTGKSGRGALESSVEGLFAVGDVRSGSVKRVGGAIGEGAAVVAHIHQRLASLGVNNFS